MTKNGKIDGIPIGICKISEYESKDISIGILEEKIESLIPDNE